MRVLVIGDVGGDASYHVGDEAMLDVALVELRRRGATELNLVSADPDATRDRYGVDAIDRIGFPDRSVRDDSLRDARLAAVTALASGRGAEVRTSSALQVDGARVRAEAMIDAVWRSDAVVVAGGGNLSSSWPEHLYERAAILDIARLAGVPAVVTSQTVGPYLTARQSEVLADSLGSARIVGVREEASYRLVADLVPSVPRRCRLDDAVALPGEAIPDFDRRDRLAEPYVVLALSPFVGELADVHLDDAAALVRQIRSTTNMPVVFVANVGTPHGQPTDDQVVGHALARLLRGDDGFVVVPMLSARATAEVCRGATAIISSRYHSVVFGLSACVPCLAITQDRYTDIKLTGALTHAGLGDWWIPLEAIGTDTARLVVDELLIRAHELTAHLRIATKDWDERQKSHWDELWCAISDEPPLALRAEPEVRRPIGRPELAPRAPGHAATREFSRRMRDATEATVQWWEHAFSEAQQYGHSVAAVLEARDREILGWQERASDLVAAQVSSEEETTAADGAARSARLLVARLGGRLDTITAEFASQRAALDATQAAEARAVDEAQQLRRTCEEAMARAEPLARQLEAVTAELDAIHATKTFRWTKRGRTIYGRYLRIRRRLDDRMRPPCV